MPCLAVGERWNLPAADDQVITRWRNKWSLPIMLRAQAFVGGRSERAFRQMVPDWIPAVNLLPPSNVSGEWDSALASRMGDELLGHAEQNGIDLILMGRRVTNAVLSADVPLCSIQFLRGSKCLVLPHPSGRCRLLNDPGTWERIAELGHFFFNPEQQGAA